MPPRAEVRRAFRWAGVTVVAAAETAAPLARAGRFLALDSRPSTVVPAITLYRAGRGHRLEGPFRPIATESPGDTLYALVEALAHVFASRARRPVLHAAALAIEGGAVLCLGAPWAGKSHLAFAALARGWRVIGDDRAVLDPKSGRIEAFPKCLKLRLSGGLPAGAGVLVGAGDAAIGAIGEDRRLIVSRANEGFVPYGVTHPLRAAVVIERGAPGGIGRIARAEALARLLDGARGGAPMTLIRALRRVHPTAELPLLRIAPGEPEAALDRLIALVRGREAVAASR